jgi:hypothetical protein
VSTRDQLCAAIHHYISTGAGDAQDRAAEAVRAYAEELKAADVPPERTLIAVKSLIRECPIDFTPTRIELLERRQLLMSEVVRWTVGAYFPAP